MQTKSEAHSAISYRGFGLDLVVQIDKAMPVSFGALLTYDMLDANTFQDGRLLRRDFRLGSRLPLMKSHNSRKPALKP